MASPVRRALLCQTLTLFEETHVSYPDFFATLTQQFNREWQTDADSILSATLEKTVAQSAAAVECLKQWRSCYHQALGQLPGEHMADVLACLRASNPMTVLLRPQIEAVWAPISEADDWQPFYDLLKKIQQPMMT